LLIALLFWPLQLPLQDGNCFDRLRARRASNPVPTKPREGLEQFGINGCKKAVAVERRASYAAPGSVYRSHLLPSNIVQLTTADIERALV
jgi:hypothetical protein